MKEIEPGQIEGLVARIKNLEDYIINQTELERSTNIVLNGKGSDDDRMSYMIEHSQNVAKQTELIKEIRSERRNFTLM